MNSITESTSRYDHLESLSTHDLLAIINHEDHLVAPAVERALPQVERLTQLIIRHMKQQGRLFYIGAGTSGRLGVLDASELPPTYGIAPDRVIGLIAGGPVALRQAVEHAEDDAEQGWLDLMAHRVSAADVVVGIAASGTTPYVLGALHHCRKEGIACGCIVSNPDTPMARVADVAVEVIVGPEVVTGSSRMKSGTAQKMVLNMLSTATMIALGRVRGNRMVNMQLTNDKLIARGTRMVAEALHTDLDTARHLLMQYGDVARTIAAHTHGSTPGTQP